MLTLFLSAIGFTSMVSFLGTLLVKQAQLQTETDSAAVAANQALRGLNTGFPCQIAQQYLQQDMSDLRTCLNVGERTRVIATHRVGGIVLTAEAWAQPQP